MPISATIMLVKRVSVVGNSGSGKTTLGRQLAAALGVPHVELDAIFHQPGWMELPSDEFRQRVEDQMGTDAGWVIDGNYSAVLDLQTSEPRSSDAPERQHRTTNADAGHRAPNGMSFAGGRRPVEVGSCGVAAGRSGGACAA